MSKQERVVCAAVQFSYEGNNEGLVVKDIVMCLDYTDKMVGCHESDLQDHGIECHLERGFITNKNRFVDPVEAMQIAIKSGQYPDYELMKRKAWEEIESAKENAKRNESAGRLGFKLYVADISEIEKRIEELGKLLERNYLLPEDLY